MEKFCPLNLSPEEIVEYTPLWEGERFADGRPRVPDEVLDRMVNVTLTQAWSVCKSAGFLFQFEGDFTCTQPGKVLVGRALTAVYMPKRPDVRDHMIAKGEGLGCVGDMVSWPIDLLSERDVYVADVFGKIEDGPVIGDNLSTAIHARTGTGVVHDAAVRDIDGIRELENFPVFCRGFHPSHGSPSTIMLMGVNTPVRIGSVTVIPGDAVLGRDDGVVFIPAHLAARTVIFAEVVSLRDDFGKQRLREGIYTPGEIDRKWEEHIEKDFAAWLSEREADLPFTKEEYEAFTEGRTW